MKYPDNTIRHKVYVQTDKGSKLHGYADIVTKIFYRNVTYHDRMHMYKAWSLHPEVMQKLKEKGYKSIIFTVKGALNTKTIRISVEDALKHGFERTHSGGPTWYIPEEHWHEIV